LTLQTTTNNADSPPCPSYTPRYAISGSGASQVSGAEYTQHSSMEQRFAGFISSCIDTKVGEGEPSDAVWLVLGRLSVSLCDDCGNVATLSILSDQW
jgi:hypothetical protein